VTRTSIVDQIRRANAPPPPDHSVTFRLSTAGAVLTGIVACGSVSELSVPVVIATATAVVAGMAFSYTTRDHPWQWLKILLAVAVVTVFGIFVDDILSAARSGALASIEVPLAGLFAWVQAIHAFDVPARRDLLFSLAAAGALVTIAGAQAISGTFAGFAAVWLLATVIALDSSWRSMAGGTRSVGFGALSAALVTVLVVALGLLLVLPQPRAAQSLTLPASITSKLPITGTGLVNGTGSRPTEPVHAGKPGGRIGVGGYLGFDGPLQTADRAALGNEVVMRVRANRPGYFLGMTYDTWNGESWIQSAADRGTTVITGGSPFQIPGPALAGAQATSNVQTFYVEQPLENLLFATEEPTEVYFASGKLIVGRDSSLRSTVALTPGTVYTVVSSDDQVAPSVLAKQQASCNASCARAYPELQRALQLPYGYPRVERLARQIVTRAHATTTVAKVEAIEGWMGRHTEYTTNIPPLQPGQDTVTEFLFGNRKGYCEQISTSLAVMLRTLGIPAREAIGYVPGPFDPLSDTYEILASDAHAWVQVYFPHYGWQNFDPTADVPLAPANPGEVLLQDVGAKVAHLPWLPIGTIGGAGMVGYGSLVYERRRRSRPRTQAGVLLLRLERAGARSGLTRSAAETLREYGQRLDGRFPGLGLEEAARLLELEAYGPTAAGDLTTAGDAVSALDRIAPKRWSWRRLLRHRLRDHDQAWRDSSQ
jgi:transglutaminase-like putative cysteine protease